jgi:hypothetical protein
VAGPNWILIIGIALAVALAKGPLIRDLGEPSPRAAHVLGMFRRLTVSFALPWLTERKRTHPRASTRDFHDHLRAANAHRARLLVTAFMAPVEKIDPVVTLVHKKIGCGR